MHLDGWQWGLATLAAFLVGLSKTGIAGIGIFAVALFSLVFRERAPGIVLPILIAADVVAVASYRRHASWPHLWRLFPWAAAGVVLAFAAMGRIPDRQAAQLIGAILLVMTGLHVWRAQTTKKEAAPIAAQDNTASDDTRKRDARKNPASDDVPHNAWFSAAMGLAGGFTTMVANAAGPVMTLYLLAMRLPKMEFFGTAAWYFLVLNVFKIPFSVGLGWISPATLRLDAWLAPVAIGGALFGRVLIPHINQKLFESLALFFSALAGLRLLLG